MNAPKFYFLHDRETGARVGCLRHVGTYRVLDSVVVIGEGSTMLQWSLLRYQLQQCTEAESVAWKGEP